MALSINSTLREILADPKGKAVILAHHESWATDPQMEPAMDLSIKEIATYSQGAVSDDSLKAMDEDLSKL